jgi:hypothetical protein
MRSKFDVERQNTARAARAPGGKQDENCVATVMVVAVMLVTAGASTPALVLGEMQSHATAGTVSVVHLAAVPQRVEEGSAVVNGKLAPARGLQRSARWATNHGA